MRTNKEEKMSDLDKIRELCDCIRWKISTANSVAIYDDVREIEQVIEKIKMNNIEFSVDRSR